MTWSILPAQAWMLDRTVSLNPGSGIGPYYSLTFDDRSEGPAHDPDPALPAGDPRGHHHPHDSCHGRSRPGRLHARVLIGEPGRHDHGARDQLGGHLLHP